MRRVMLWVLLAVALPTAALANSITYATGHFVSGICVGGHCPTPTRIGVDITGSLDKIDLSAELGMLTSCPGHLAGTCYNLPFGSVDVFHASTLLFQDFFFNVIANKDGNAWVIMGRLASPLTMPFFNGSFTVSFTLPNARATVLADGTATVKVSYLPEPSTLGLIGTGVVGLAGLMMRNRLRA